MYKTNNKWPLYKFNDRFVLINSLKQFNKGKYLLEFDNKKYTLNQNNIKSIIDGINSGNVDDSYSSSDDDTIITFIGNKAFSFIGKVFFSLPITDILYTFVLGRTDKVINLDLQSKDFCFCVELPIKAHKNKLKLTSSPANERRRIAGKKKVNAFKDGLKILLSMFKLLFNK